jgi:DinB family protein
MSIFSNRFSDAKQEAGEYTRAVLGLLGDRDPVPVLERTPVLVAEQLAGLAGADLARPERPGKWSMLHVVRHLADSDLVWGYRLRRILAEDRPSIHGYDQDLWSEHLHYERADAAESLAELRAVRTGNLRLIRPLGPAELARVGVHTERGEESIAHLLRMYAGHDILHLNQMERIRSSLVGAVGA